MRPTAVADRFYPGNPEALAALVDALLAEAPPPPSPSRPVALVAPHAGYRFSGRVAAKAYAHLSRWRGKLARVVVLGPGHFMPLHEMAIPTVDAFATPLGPVPIDVDARTVATGLPAVVVDDEPHAGEHAIETQLPFLIRTLGPAVSILPVVVGNTSPHAVAALLAALLDTPGSIAVVSTDLSHHLPEARARERDAVTAAAVLDRNGEAIQPADACGSHPLRGLLSHAVDRDLDVDLLELATSADAGGDPRRVVGYGAFVLHDEAGTGRKGNRSTPDFRSCVDRLVRGFGV
jgi:hypothetical protein